MRHSVLRSERHSCRAGGRHRPPPGIAIDWVVERSSPARQRRRLNVQSGHRKDMGQERSPSDACGEGNTEKVAMATWCPEPHGSARAVTPLTLAGEGRRVREADDMVSVLGCASTARNGVGGARSSRGCFISLSLSNKATLPSRRAHIDLFNGPGRVGGEDVRGMVE